MPMQPLTIADLFEPKSNQWNLRGDAYLWDELQAYFSGVPLPDNSQELTELVIEAFEVLTSRPLTDDKTFFIDKLAKGEMISGCVSPPFWRERALPLLQLRYEYAYTFER
ncbi:hypothetical protein [Thiofilum flexile]|uniref:hypothetical protein n=1 Tax=Thiofilum flexile TaxID=125627 RepID=UPI000379BF66|nr:hypothetical protein [Thiofilum flexile]